jgi:hypothetical protein
MLKFMCSKAAGTFYYHGQTYTLNPIGPPQIELNDILVITWPLDLTICRENPAIQTVSFETDRLPGFPQELRNHPAKLAEGSKLLILRGGGIGDVSMLTPALKILREQVGKKITINLATYADRQPLLNELGYVDNFYPLPLNLADFMAAADYYCDFSDHKRIFNQSNMIDFHLNYLCIEPTTITPEKKLPELSLGLTGIPRIIASIAAMATNYSVRVFYAGRASDPVRDLPPEILRLLADNHPNMAFFQAMNATTDPELPANVFALDTSGGLSDFVTAIANCDIVVATDSSAYHLAAALGKPTMVFFGPIDSKLRATYYPKVVALDPDFQGQTCHSPCGISALNETPPNIGIGAGKIQCLTDGAILTTFKGRDFTYHPALGCPEANCLGTSHSPCLMSMEPDRILTAFAQTCALIGNPRHHRGCE